MGNGQDTHSLQREKEKSAQQEKEIRRLEELKKQQKEEDLRKQRELEQRLRESQAKEEEIKEAREKQERQQKEKEERLARELKELKEQQIKQRKEEEEAKKRKHLEDEEKKRKYLEPLETPWRKISSKWEDPWTQEFKEELLGKINSIKPAGDIKYFNILLLGQAASGKSSFFNTCLTAIINEDRLVTSSLIYQSSGRSVTTALEAIPIKTKEGKILPLRLFDCRGLNVEYGVPTEDIRAIVEGRVKSGYKINPVAPIDEEDAYYRKNPETKDRMHCVVYVANAENPVEHLTDHKTEEQLRYVRENLARQHLPQMVLFNKVDKLRISNTHSLRDIFRSQDVRDTCAKAAEYMQIPLTHVFPMANYHKEAIPTLEKDILALFYLLTMMQRANDFILRLTKDEVPEDFYD